MNGADLASTTAAGFTKEALYSTQSYQATDLHGIGLSRNNLTGWSFRGQNLSDAVFDEATLKNADLTRAVVAGASFIHWNRSGEGLTKEQLYSTASYQARQLQRIKLGSNNLVGWDFNGQDLTGAYLQGADLTDAEFIGANLSSVSLHKATLSNADLSGANLTSAYLHNATLTNANLTGANVAGALLHGARAEA